MEERLRRWRCIAVCGALSLLMAVPMSSAVPQASARTVCMTAFARSAGDDGAALRGQDSRCRAVLAWPVAEPVEVLRGFDGPAQPWLPGHRGVDLKASAYESLLAPGDGTISFAGTVAGKQVVSIRCRNLTLTFEPAVTDRSVGAQVKRGEPFATVGEESDHCDGPCVHWGVRRGKQAYLDPQDLVMPWRIALKPVA